MGRYGLRADQWERISHLLPGKDGDVGVTAKDKSFSLTPCCIGIVRAFPGGIYLSGLALRSTSIRGSVVGPKVACGKGFCLFGCRC